MAYRVIRKPRADYGDPQPPLAPAPWAFTVFEPEAIDTGLVDVTGSRIMRMTDPIGFVTEFHR